MRTIQEIYEAFKNGDPLSDAELVVGIQYFNELARKAAAVGPSYSLMVRDASQVAACLNSSYTARSRRQQLLGEHRIYNTIETAESSLKL